MTLDLSTHEKQAAHYGAIRAKFFTGAGVQDRLAHADHTVRVAANAGLGKRDEDRMSPYQDYRQIVRRV